MTERLKLVAVELLILAALVYGIFDGGQWVVIGSLIVIMSSQCMTCWMLLFERDRFHGVDEEYHVWSPWAGWANRIFSWAYFLVVMALLYHGHYIIPGVVYGLVWVFAMILLYADWKGREIQRDMEQAERHGLP